MKKKLQSIITVILLLLLISPTVVLGQAPAVEYSNDSQLYDLHAAILFSNEEMAKRFMIDKERKFKILEDRLQVKVNGEQEAVENVLKQTVLYCSRGSPG